MSPAAAWRGPRVSLVDSHGTPSGTGEWAGTPTLLVFVPMAFTPVCGAEMADLAALALDGVRVVVASCDPGPALRAWDEANGWGLSLVSDFWPHGDLARAFDAFDEATGRARRVTVLLGADGAEAWRTESPAGLPRDARAYAKAVAAL